MSRRTARSTGSWSARLARPDPARSGRRVYLDYAGFSPVDPRVVSVMTPFLEGWVGNPGATHALGEEARESLMAARAKVGRLIGGRPEGVVFTSGATEANNLALKGVGSRRASGHLVVASIDHISVLTPCRELSKRGFAVTLLPVDACGRLDPDALRGALRPETCLVSIGAANAEVGTIQPWRDMARVTRAAGVPLHVDGVGAVGRVPLSVDADGIDLLTVAANDLHGPPGVGALWVRPGLRLSPQVLGGGQEDGLRSGTENLAGVVGLGVAAELVRREGPAEVERLARLRDRLLDGVDAARCGITITGPRHDRLPHHVSLAVDGVKSESLVLALDLAGISVSTGSPCSASTGEPSHVLRAMGLDARLAAGSLCLTLGRWTRPEDIDLLLSELPAIVQRLRALSPFA